jgi:glycosyltransferase involved in cell wall biosynthesis
MISRARDGVRYSLVLPVFNEEAVLPLLLHRLDRLVASLDAPAEIIFVDDGSRDTSAIILEALAKEKPHVRFLKLSRNFGQQYAATAGMDAASGDAVILMDADLQDPPEIVHEMIARWREGYEIVYARRRTRDGEGFFKKLTSKLFYRLLGKISDVDIPRDVGDFRLIDRKVLEAFCEMPERDRFVRGMFAWLGFKHCEVAFDRSARAAGKTKYPFWKMVRFAVNGVVSFSDAPLKLAIWVGASVCVFAAGYGMYAIYRSMLADNVVSGWASTVVIVSLLCGINMLLTGMIGVYVGRIHAEVKRRPLYVVSKRVGFESPIETGAHDQVRNAG